MGAHEDQEIVNFLRKSENLRIALDVGEYVEKLKDSLAKEFWHGLTRHIERRLTDFALQNTWKVQQMALDEDKRWQNHTGLSIAPRMGQRYCGPAVAVQNLQLYFGIRCEGILDSKPVALMRIATSLGEKKYRESPPWLGYRWSEIYVDRTSFYEMIAQGGADMLDELAELLCDLLLQYKQGLEEANSELLTRGV